MATEILAVPEEYLGEVIAVIRAGLAATKGSNVSGMTRNELAKWCNEESDYLNSLKEERETATPQGGG